MLVELDTIHRLLTLGFWVCCVQTNDYDAALVAAFRREQEKEAQLKATIAAKQIAEQLVRSSSWFCISTLQALHNQRKCAQVVIYFIT